jgi:hypothetical protein
MPKSYEIVDVAKDQNGALSSVITKSGWAAKVKATFAILTASNRQ